MNNTLTALADNIMQLQHNNGFYLYDSQLVQNFQPEMLSSKYWLTSGKVLGQAHGRGITYFVAGEQAQQWVLRHYYRGGLMGKVNRDSYIFSSLAKTRAFAEFNLLQTMHKQGLPSPKPVACRVMKKGFAYQADLLTSRVENAKDLVAILTEQSLSATLWQKIGQVIGQFHQQGIYHHDLNAHNILLDDNEKVWLIDFDRGEKRVLDCKWQQANMARLQRSFLKEQGKLAQFHWHSENWQQLMLGYQNK